MPQSWEKGQKSAELPNPQLNPLQNPTLGRHLGRWAQVYFTSPPEKREQAVGDLLRELEAESIPEQPKLSDTPAAHTAVPSLICEVCQQPNELDQKFCGLCGSRLRGPSSAPEPPAPHSFPPRTIPHLHEAAPPARTENPTSTADEDGLEWLREKSLSRLSEPEEPSGRWKYALMATALVLAGFGILQWISNRPVATTLQTVTSSTPDQVPERNRQAVPPAVTPSALPATKPPQASIEGASQNPNHLATVPASYPSPLPATANPADERRAVAAEGGGQELALAQGYLEGKHGRRDSAEAAKWLWKAVAKQNTTADVLLADLYQSGDGVGKNCDQARLLLVAAAQKGAPNAAEKLRTLESAGCR